jgi:hypothetical protein
MISGFASVSEDVVVGLLEGDGRLLNVRIDVFIAGYVPENLILRCGGSSWMLRLRFLVGDTVAKQLKSSRPAADEEAVVQELGVVHGDEPLTIEIRKDFCVGEMGEDQNGEEEDLGGGVTAGPMTTMAGDMLAGDMENVEQETHVTQIESLKDKQDLQEKEGLNCEGGSHSKTGKGRSPYSLRQRKSKTITLMDEDEVARVLQVCKCQALRGEGFG